MNSEQFSTTLDDQSNSWDILKDIPSSAEENPTIPTTSPNKLCAQYLRAIEKFNYRMNDVQDFIHSSLDRKYHTLNPEELTEFANEYSAALNKSIDNATKSELKNYSGYNYRSINQVARGQWDYETSGERTAEKLHQAHHVIETIHQAITESPNIGIDFKAYRGTNLDSFQGYNVDSISNLTNLKGQFFLEQGFTSTSLSPEKSFSDRQFDDPLRKSCDIQITYHIPQESHDGIALLSEETSYSPEQQEYLIDQNSLSYITEVKINPDHTATVNAILIPKSIYDPIPHP